MKLNSEQTIIFEQKTSVSRRVTSKMTEKDHPDKIMDAQSAGALLSPLGSTVAELNIGGQAFTTTLETLGKYPDSLLGLVFSKLNTTIPLLKDTRGRFFMDRDGNLFRLNFVCFWGLHGT